MNREQLKQLETDLWAAADNFRANSDLKSSEYFVPVLGLIFLKFADNKYRQFEDEILKEYEKLKGGRRKKPISDIAIEKCGFYLPDHARYKCLWINTFATEVKANSHILQGTYFSKGTAI